MKTAHELKKAAEILAGCYWDRVLADTVGGITGFDRRTFVDGSWAYFVPDVRMVFGETPLVELAKRTA